jgi:hypothetical protein
MASDTAEGSKSVQISGQEVMLKNKSSFKQSTGDEAGSAAKKGAVTSNNKGKVYFVAWSMDVKIEGENAVRHMDMTTGNHASPAANTPPWSFLDNMTKAQKAKCAKNKREEKTACKDYKPHKEDGKDVCKEAGLKGSFSYDKATVTRRMQAANENPCAKARRCALVPYDGKPDGIHGCCPAQTPDHVVPKSSFFVRAVDGGDGRRLAGWTKDNGKGGYDIDEAPCMCLEGGSCSGGHGLRHAHHKACSDVESGTIHPFDDECSHCAEGAHAVAPNCDKECIEAQLQAGHAKMGDTSGDVKHSSTGKNMTEDEIDEKLAEMEVSD